MKISASLYSGKTEEFLEMATELERFGVDYFHIDCNDNPAVFDDIKELRKITNVPVDLHLITPRPSRYYELIRDAEVEYVSFQYETLEEPLAVPDYISSRLGLAIVSDTDISVFEQFADRFSFILFMTTEPGKSGGIFNEKNFDKIRLFRTKFPNKLIHADGGVNDDVAFILRSLGVNSAVCGSYLMKNENRGKALLHLKTTIREYSYHVSDFMMKPAELPILQEKDLTLEALLKEITRYQLGFAIVVKENRELAGIVTDFDIRKGLIEHFDDLNNIKKVDFINRSPVFVRKDQSIDELLELVRRSERPIRFIPVLNGDRELVGAVSFNSLVKGEI